MNPSTQPELFFIPPNRVWRTYPGGRILDTQEGKANPEDGPFPEDWICSTTRAVNEGREDRIDEGLSSVLIGKKAHTLQNLVGEHPDLLGADHFDRFGASPHFLLKFLDAAIRLHIQCHPTAAFAQARLGSSSGKTEAYVILQTRTENAFVYLGFQHLPDRETFATNIRDQNIPGLLSCFEKIPVRPGDVFIVPGGLPHAIGAGVFMIEIMEPTDFAIRLEFERGGYVLPEEARFMGRDLDFALSMLEMETYTTEQIREKCFVTPRVLSVEEGGRESLLIGREQTDCFSVKKLDVSDRLNHRELSFYTAIVTRGAGIACGSGADYPLHRWDRFFVPAGTDRLEYRSTEGMEIVLVLPPTAGTEQRQL